MEPNSQARQAVKPIPSGYPTVTPYICIHDASKLLDFLSRAFGSVERFRFTGENGVVTHAEVQIGNSIVMLEEVSDKNPAATGGFYMYVDDADKTYARAMEAGAKTVSPPSNLFYGDRVGVVRDSWGNLWSVATHVEDVSEAELRNRARASMR